MLATALGYCERLAPAKAPTSSLAADLAVLLKLSAFRPLASCVDAHAMSLTAQGAAPQHVDLPGEQPTQETPSG